MRNTTIPNKSEEVYGGFDLSLTASGIVIINAKGEVKERHVVSFSKLRGPERLNAIQQGIRSIIAMYNLKSVCIEGYAMGAVGKTYNIGELGGVIRLLLWRLKIPYFEPPPHRVKKFATGKGGGEGGSKDQVTLHCFKNWNFEATSNDEADAYVLAQICRGLSGHGEWKSYQKEVISEMLNPPVKVKKGKKNE